MTEELTQQVARQIEEAFADTPYPGDGNICHYAPFGDDENVRRDFTGKSWKVIYPEFVIVNREVLRYLEPKAFHFYLPAYLLTVILYPDQADLLRQRIVEELYLPDYMDSVLTVNDQEFIRKAKLFTQYEIETIISFLNWYRDWCKVAEEIMLFLPDLVDSVIIFWLLIRDGQEVINSD